MTSVHDFMKEYMRSNGPGSGKSNLWTKEMIKLMLKIAEAYADRRELEIRRELNK